MYAVIEYFTSHCHKIIFAEVFGESNVGKMIIDYCLTSDGHSRPFALLMWNRNVHVSLVPSSSVKVKRYTTFEQVFEEYPFIFLA